MGHHKTQGCVVHFNKQMCTPTKVCFWNPETFEVREVECRSIPVKIQHFVLVVQERQQVKASDASNTIQAVLSLCNGFEMTYFGGYEIQQDARWYVVLSSEKWSIEINRKGSICIRDTMGTVLLFQHKIQTWSQISQAISIPACGYFCEALLVETG